MFRKRRGSPGVHLEGDALVYVTAALSYATAELFHDPEHSGDRVMVADCLETVGDWFQRLGKERALELERQLVGQARRELDRQGQLNVWTTATRWRTEAERRRDQETG